MLSKKFLMYLFLLILLLVSVQAISATDVDNITCDIDTVQEDTITSNPVYKNDNTLQIDNEKKNISKKNSPLREDPNPQHVSLSSTNTSLVSGIYSAYPSNVTITCDNSAACGDVDLYIDGRLVESYSNLSWNNLNVSVPDIRIVNQLPVVPEYFNRTGNYSWRLVFKDNLGYQANRDISGTLEMTDYVELTLIDNVVPCYPYEFTDFEFKTRPDNLLGAVVINNEGHLIAAEAINITNNTIRARITLDPGKYNVYAYYEADVATDSYYTEHGIDPNFKYNTYPQSRDSNYVTLTVLKVPVYLRSFNTSFDDENNLYFTMNLSSRDNVFDRYYDGVLNIYNNDTLIKSVDLDDFNDDGMEHPSLINFTLNKCYNNKNLRFEYTDRYDYYDNLLFERLIDVEKKDIKLTVTSKNITADTGDIIEISYYFNDSVDDGKLSISYGGSDDNTTEVTTNSGVICFNTTNYRQGEYDLILRYYDSSVYNETNIPITLRLYQPTSITANKDELNIVLGKGNEYLINFETNRDSWDDVIWGSIDVYVDEDIIYTIIIDDTTGNHGSIRLNDYNLEDVTPGTHTLGAVFTSDDPYIRSSQTTLILNVSGDVILELPENPTAMIKEDYVMPVNITFNGKILNTGNITWYFENIAVSHVNLTTDNNREFTRYINDDAGLYNIRIEYTDYDNIYPSATNTTTLLVRSNTTIETETISSYVKNTTINISLADDKNNYFNGLVNAILPDGTVIENISCTPGTLFIKDLPSGENDIIITYPESQYYKAATVTQTVNVKKSDAENTNFLVNDTAGNVTLEVWLYDSRDTDTYPGGVLEVINKATGETVGRNNIESKKTNVTLNINKKGDYELSIKYNGSKYYNPLNTTQAVTVQGRLSETMVTVNNKTYANTSIIVTVKDPQTNKNITDAPLKITLPDGTIINSNTGSTGTINIPVDIPAGENMIRVEFPGDDTYNTSVKNIDTTILPRQSQTRAAITNSSIRNVTVNVTVTDKITGATITSGDIEILDKNQNTVARGSINNDNTLITTSIDSKDINELTVNYLGNINYTASTYTIENIQVTGRLSEIDFKVINNTYENTSVTVTVTDPVTGTPIPYAEIIITLTNGTTETVTSDADGNYIITNVLPVGENTITVEFTGNDEYNTTIKTCTFNISRRESDTTAAIINNTVRNTTINVVVTDKTTGQAVLYGDVEIVNLDTREVIGRATLSGTNTVNIKTDIEATSIYHIIAIFKGNTNYTNSNFTPATFNVERRISQTDIIVTSDLYQDTQFNITVRDQVTGTPITNAPVTITLPDNTTINKLTDNNGTITINPELPTGKNTITVTYNGNEEYNSSTQTTTINITKRPTQTTATINNNTVKNTTITVTVTDKTTGTPVNSGQIEITNQETGALIATETLTKDNINIPVNLPAGTYNLSINYQGNTNYTVSNTTLKNINIEKREANIIISTLNDTINNTKINITIQDKVTGETITNAPITITLPDNKTISTHTGTTGTITQTLTLPAENNTITITYTGNKQYNTTTNKHTINIKKLTSIITVNTQTGYIRENITLTATITDTHGNKITGGRAIFKLNDITLKNNKEEAIYATIKNGTATISYYISASYRAKTYKLSAVYGGNQQYTETRSNPVLLNLKQRQANLTINTNKNIKTGENMNIHITITDKHDPQRQINGNIIIKIDGLTLKNTKGETLQIPIHNNTAQYNHTITNNYSPRKHTITAVLINNTYTRSQTENSFNITKTTTNIQLNPATTTQNNKTTLTGTITDNHGNKITGTNKIAIKIDGKTLKNNKGKTQYHNIKNGQINITINTQNYKKGKHTIEVVTGERNTYTGARNTTTLTINPNKTTLTTPQITNKEFINIQTTKTQTNINQTGQITITITDTNNTKITHGTITWKQNNKTLSTNQVKNGTGKLNTRYTKPGTYTITTTYNDNTGKYQTTHKTFQITVNDPRTPTTTTSKNTKTTVGETLTYTITTQDPYKNKINTGTIITKINNQTYTNTPNNGITTITITLNKTGTYTITNTYTGTTTHQPSNNTQTITITKKTPKITINKPTITPGKTNTITTTITTQDNVPLNEGKIQWKINGKTLKNNKNKTIQTTIKDAKSTLEYNIPNTWAGKQINITATYTGSTNFNTKTTTTTTQIPQLKATATITIPNTIKTRDNITINITIKDKNTGKPVTGNNKIAIKLNQKTIQTTKLNNGTTTIKYKLPLLKTTNTHKITITHANKNYATLETHKQFKIQKTNTTTTLKNQKIKQNKTLHIQTTIKDTHGETIKTNDKYTIKLNGKTIHTSRLKNGQIDYKLPVNYKKRTYNLTIKTANNHYYNGLNKTVKLTVT